MLGLARRAGKLSMGHDMATQSISKRKARLVILCRDVSPRLVREFRKTLELKGNDIPLIQADITIDEIHQSAGYHAGVLTVDDDNFSDRIISLLTQEE